MKKFEYQIEVFDKDLTDSGQIQLRPRGQQTVTASSRQELINLYTMCDQQIKILSERPLPTEQTNRTAPAFSNDSAQQEALFPTSAPALSKEAKSEETHNTQNISVPEVNIAENNMTTRRFSTAFQPMPKSAPKYYKLGDIEIKEHCGKIYQKQWIKLNVDEASNIRIINTKTNKVVPMEGKHVEVKRWILVEDSNSENNELQLKD